MGNAKMPVVINGVLYVEDIERCVVGSLAWVEWLRSAPAFYVRALRGSFSVRVQQHRRKRFWYAYKRVAGRLYKFYLGRGEDLTQEKLDAMALRVVELTGK